MCFQPAEMKTQIPVSSFNEHTAERFQMRFLLVSLAALQLLLTWQGCAANLSFETPHGNLLESAEYTSEFISGS